jgi:hypothetical protein
VARVYLPPQNFALKLAGMNAKKLKAIKLGVATSGIKFHFSFQKDLVLMTSY